MARVGTQPIRPVRADGRETRRRIVATAERFLADDGIEGASLADIADAAGQANRSAVQYHFGSRQGLIDEIIFGHQAVADRLRLDQWPDIADLELEELIRCLVEPAARELENRSGRYYLIILAQVLHRYPEVVRRSPEFAVLVPIFSTLTARLDHIPSGLAGPRVSAMITFGIDTLADRARVRRQRQANPGITDRVFVDDLIQMMVAALSAPPPPGLVGRPISPE